VPKCVPCYIFHLHSSPRPLAWPPDPKVLAWNAPRRTILKETMAAPSSTRLLLAGGMDPGLMPPMSAWWPLQPNAGPLPIGCRHPGLLASQSIPLRYTVSLCSPPTHTQTRTPPTAPHQTCSAPAVCEHQTCHGDHTHQGNACRASKLVWQSSQHGGEHAPGHHLLATKNTILP
jgi:hypothetical protein